MLKAPSSEMSFLKSELYNLKCQFIALKMRFNVDSSPSEEFIQKTNIILPTYKDNVPEMVKGPIIRTMYSPKPQFDELQEAA
jgi:hypothetical protein